MLYIERPYAKPCGAGVNGQAIPFCLEYGPATMLYIAPCIPQMVCSMLCIKYAPIKENIASHIPCLGP